ncbi:MAG: hypothetical protein DRG71_03830 [Deltaproteobacteria bacterium]|nr:MAG: hypothetical protein DRG71_03830 [Deltaproteobacteria bacterium]
MEARMHQGGSPYKRQTYLVEKRFQISFILKFCLLVLAGVIVSSALIILLTRGTLTSTFVNSKLTIQSTASVILPALLYTNLITLGLVTVATIVVTLFVSHKIAGPLYRLEKELKAIGDGDLTRQISLRRKDQVTRLARSLDEAVNQLRAKVKDIRTDLEQLDELARKQDVPEHVVQAVERVKMNLENHFKI